MPQQDNRKQSKLKFRSRDFTPVKAKKTERVKSNRHTNSDRRKSTSVSNAHQTQSSTLYTIAKGVTALLFVAVVLHWTALLPFSTPFLKSSAQLPSSENQIITVNAAAQQETADTNTRVGVTEPTLETDTKTADSEIRLEPYTPESTTDTVVVDTQIPATENTAADNTAVLSAQNNESAIVNTELASNNSDLAKPVVVDDIPNAPTTQFVKAYRATMFSSRSANARETRIAQGTSVRVLERIGDWVRIEVSDTGVGGYIHITQLSIQ